VTDGRWLGARTGGAGVDREQAAMIVNLWRYRGFIARNAVSDIRNRYAGSAIGVAWNVLHPLAQIAIYSVVFSQLMAERVPGAGPGFALYLCAGLLPWSAFADCVQRGANAFIENAPYLKKLPIPEQVFVAQSAVAATLFLGISMTLLALATLLIGGRVSISWIGVPVVLLLLQGFGFGLGLLFSTLNVFLRDIGQVLAIGLQLWMWLTPIVYVEQILPPELQALMRYNPAYPFIDALHRMIVNGEWPAAWQWPVMAAWAGAAPVAGYLVMRRLRREIRDVL
jgi:ABC-type polysaccharide/polyol phosphate export permease